jgi:hypothetical protein
MLEIKSITSEYSTFSIKSLGRLELLLDLRKLHLLSTLNIIYK